MVRTVDHETAAYWLDVIAAGAAVLWLAGAWFVMSTVRRSRQPLHGEAEVACDPATLITRLTKSIADARAGSPLQNSAVEGACANEVRWRSTGVMRHSGTARATGDRKTASVAWQIETGGGLLLGARLVVVLGAFVVGGLYWLLSEYVLPNENLGIRGQVFQMVQAIHVLWPPFLLAGLARKLRRMVADEVRRVVQNAPFS